MSNTIKKLAEVAGRLLLAYLLVFGQGVWARQEQSANQNPEPTQKSAAQAPVETLSSAAITTKAKTGDFQREESAKAAKEEKSSGDGQHEGIKVHGHWTIEVHNADGSLARHVEFENSLDPGFTFASPGVPPIPVPGGAAYLSAALSGQWAAPAQYNTTSQWPIWEILLVGSGLNSIATTTASPCSSPKSWQACVIAQNAPTIPGTGAGCFPSPGFSCNLSVVPLGTAPNFTGFQLSGSVAATQNGQVSTVATLLGVLSCLASASAANCPSNLANASFTSSTNFPGAPINVVANQTVAVTVNITFS